MSKSLALANYIIFSFCMLVYIYLIISYIIYKKNQDTKPFFLKLNIFIYTLFILSIFIESLAYTINILDYEKYRKVCPFTLDNIDSRYSFQYICSYDPSNDLKNLELNKDEYESSNKLEIVRCLLANNLIKDNEIIFDFASEYKNINKYYCSLVFKPKLNILINNDISLQKFLYLKQDES